MKLSDLRRGDEILAHQFKDPEFRAQWERTARAVHSRAWRKHSRSNSDSR